MDSSREPGMPPIVRDGHALDRIRHAFAACPRPAHFTNRSHCAECAEHDDTLLARTPDTLTSDDVGNPCWSPIAFLSPEGFAYYLPGLARLALDDGDPAADWYAPQFFWALISSGAGNERFLHCSPAQREAVAAFLSYLIETRVEQIEEHCAMEDAVRAFEIWGDVRPPRS